MIILQMVASTFQETRIVDISHPAGVITIRRCQKHSQLTLTAVIGGGIFALSCEDRRKPLPIHNTGASLFEPNKSANKCSERM